MAKIAMRWPAKPEDCTDVELRETLRKLERFSESSPAAAAAKRYRAELERRSAASPAATRPSE